MKTKILTILAAFLLPVSAFAAQISVPSASGLGYMLLSNAGGSYTATATTTFLGAGTPGNVLSWLNGIPSWTATTTFSSPLNYANGAVTLSTAGTWSGLAGTATAFATTPTKCSAGNYPLGIDVSGNAQNCTAAGAGGTGLSTTTPIAGSNVLVYSAAGAGAAYGVATSTLTVSGPFTYPTISAVGGNGAITYTGLATTSQPSSSNLLVSNGTTGVYGVATSTLTASGPLTGSFTQVGSGGSLGCTTASNGVAGCLNSTDWATFNGKQAALSTPTWPIKLTGTTLSTDFSTTTNSGISAGNLYIGSSGAFLTTASSSIFGYTPLNPTRNINTTWPITGGGDLSADRTIAYAGFGTTSDTGIGNNLVLYTNAGGIVKGVSTSTIGTFLGSQSAGVLGTSATGLLSMQATSTLYGAASTGGYVLQWSNTTNGLVLAATSSSAAGVTSVTGTYPISSSGGATPAISTAFGTTTNNGMSAGNLYVGSGGVFQTAASSSIFGYTPLNPTRQLTISSGNGQIVSSAGAQDLSADRTWTLTYTGLATTSQPSSSNLLVSNGGTGVFGVATTTASCSGSNSCTPFTVIGSSPITISNSGGAGSWTANGNDIYNNNSGNVGIASSTPWAQLSVGIPSWSATKPMFAIGSSTSSATTTSFIVDHNGNVGIGTSSPSVALTISNAINALGGLLINTWTNVTNAFSIVNAAGSTVFNVDTTATNPKLGVGTSTPWGTLSVTGNGTDPIFAVATTSNQGLPNVEIDSLGYLITGGSAPTFDGTCGTSPSVAAGSDGISGSVTLGTGAVSSCTGTFVPARTSQAFCQYTVSSTTPGVLLLGKGMFVMGSSSASTFSFMVFATTTSKVMPQATVNWMCPQ